MNKLPKLIMGVVLVFLLFQRETLAVTIAEQTQNWSAQLAVFQTIQELGSNLSGTLASFTFRVSTSRSNLNQFDYTASNTRIYDKSNSNSYTVGCVPQNSNPNDGSRGLTFNKTGVPQGYQDVTIDFSCQNYEFTAGHRYLIQISNANIGNSGSGQILFAAAAYANAAGDLFSGGGVRYGNGNPYDYSNNSGSCDPAAYTWNSTDPWHNGCYVWGLPQNDLYFILSNNSPPPPPPKTPVIFIPGIGGSELKAAQDIVWSKEDGHGGIYSHAYTANEKIWVNQDEAQKLGDDDYFDVLRLKTDGVTSEADLSLTGDLTSQGYGDIDSFFVSMGYTKGTNYFVFNYDWRKDVRSNKDSLDSLIEQAKTLSGQSKVNLVVHSLGGLIARYYISDSTKASKVNKLIELGVPHLGATSAIKTLMYGFTLQKNVFGIFPLGIPASEVKDATQNNPGLFQLLPSTKYFNFNDISPFRDDRDIDSNKITGILNYDQIKNLLSNLSHNMTVFGLGEQFHNTQDALYNQTNGVKIYEIAGTAQPTLGQIHETWWITWPINLIPKTDEIFINGDDTVPLYSASLKNDTQDISGADKIYYVEQKHSDLVSSSGTAMQTVKVILNDDNALPTEVKSIKIDLEGEQLSLDDGELELYDDEGKHTGIKDNGEIETNIPETFYSTSGKTKHAFIKKKSKKVTVKVTRKSKTSADPKTTNLKIRKYKQDKISKTTLYKDLPIDKTGKVEFTLDPALDTTPSLTLDSTTINATSEITTDTLDQTPPSTKIETSGTNPVTVTLTASDSGSGILKTEYSLDNGQTVQTYTNPFTISTSGKTTIQVKSIDKLGNEEIPQTITIEIATPATSSSSNSGTSSSNSVQNTSEVKSSNTSEVDKATTNSLLSPPAVLGISFENPSHISDEINTSNILGEQKNSIVTDQPANLTAKQILSGLFIVSAGVATLASLGFAATFLKPTPK